MSEASPIVADWVKQGLDWMYIFQPTLKAFIIPAGGMVQVPYVDFIYTYPEGIIIDIGAVFDSPLCGIRMSAEPNIDTQNILTVAAVATAGIYTPECTPIVRALIPPQTLSGIFTLYGDKEWPWKETLSLYVFNVDTVDHYCLSLGYTLAVLKKPRKVPALEE